jgi:PAS domain S-box-containing protein
MASGDSILSCLPTPAVAFSETLDAVAASRPAFELFGVPCLAGPDPESLVRLGETILKRRDLIALLGAASMRLRTPGDRERFAWQDGPRRHEVSLAAAPGPDGGLLFLACFLDQTGQVELERGSARARSFLESIMSSLHLGLAVVNRDLQVTNLNATQQEQLAIMGSSAPALSLIGRPLAEVFPDEAEVIQTLAPDVLDKSAVCGGIVERYEADGVEHVFSVGFSPLRDETGGVVGMIRVAEEITDREKMAQDLHQAELRASEVETIHKLMVTLNHEINNSLTAITGNIELLRFVGGPLPPEKEVMLREIATHAERITAVTERLRNAQQVRTVAYLKDGTNMIDTGLPEAGSAAG